jgi:O-antigen ligase
MRLSKLYIPASAMLCFGYPMTTVAATLAGLPVGQVNILLKAFYAGLFLLSIIATLKKLSVKLPALTLPLFAFFILYGIRLVVDLYILGVYAPLSSPAYTLSYFFLLTLLPAVSIARAWEPSDMKALNTWIYGVLLLSAVMVFVWLQQSESQLLAALSTERIEMRGEVDATARLNPITVGSVGCALAIMSIALLSLNTNGQSWLRFLLLMAGAVLGLGTLFLAGSRGPLLAFVVSLALLVLGILRTQLLRKGRQSGISSRHFTLIVAIIIGAVFAFQRSDMMFLALERLLTTITELGSGSYTEARTYIAIDALDNVANSPFFGSGHLALGNTAYAHNSILEALMATGLFGGALFVGSLMIVVSQVWQALSLRRDPLAFPLAPVVLSLLVISLFSASISQSPEIWVSVFLFLTIASRTKRVAPRPARPVSRAPPRLHQTRGSDPGV